jgi:uncharacterized protein (TIGR02270 family)
VSASTEILWDVVEEHLSEAEFLVDQWLAAGQSARLTLADLQRTTERRLLAHIDGLALGGAAVARETLLPVMADDSEAPAARVAAATLGLLSGGTSPATLAERLRGGAPPEVVAGVAIGLHLTGRLDVDEPLRLALYASGDPGEQAAILSALIGRRIDPGPLAANLAAGGDAKLAALALTSLAAAERSQFRAAVENQVTGEVNARAGAALRTALIWNLATAWRTCPSAARAGSLDAMLALALFGRPTELAPVLDALRAPATRAPALFALGFSGRPEAVDACLPFLDDEAAAPLAAEAVAAVTGVPLFDPPFAAPPKEGDEEDDELPPLEVDLQTDLGTPSHAKLPVPQPTAYRDWWTKNHGRFAPGERYLRGRPLTAEALGAGLSAEPLRRRGPLAFELAVRAAGRVRIPSPRLAQPALSLPPDLATHRPPAWS